MEIDLNRPLKPRDNPTVVIPLHELRALEALAEELKGELEKLMQELHDSKYESVCRLRSLNAWKAKAKQWREKYFDMKKDMWKWFYKCEELDNLLHRAEALAADRKKLLRRENTIRFSRGKQCFFCDRYPLLNAKVGSDYEKVYIDNHADDCEWDKELGDD